MLTSTSVLPTFFCILTAIVATRYLPYSSFYTTKQAYKLARPSAGRGKGDGGGGKGKREERGSGGGKAGKAQKGWRRGKRGKGEMGGEGTSKERSCTTAKGGLCYKRGCGTLPL